ncbi:hypothetical protein DPX16_8573 [Anabarilius grahami]|uniref:Uncharacterized protein n=1 Tax=Anabarilius grahami TaxID=495550 RepID=A0A3N0Y9H5_ANAGA|nr:hypothetical protein DPX16_8573 [Anabarilius grahami]
MAHYLLEIVKVLNIHKFVKEISASHETEDYGGPKCPSVVPFEILHSEGPFEVASFEHFGLERHFNMAAMIVFTPEGDISRLERTERELGALLICVIQAIPPFPPSLIDNEL